MPAETASEAGAHCEAKFAGTILTGPLASVTVHCVLLVGPSKGMKGAPCDEIHAITVVEPNLFVPFVAEVIREGPFNGVPHQSIEETHSNSVRNWSATKLLPEPLGPVTNAIFMCRARSSAFENANTPR